MKLIYVVLAVLVVLWLDNHYHFLGVLMTKFRLAGTTVDKKSDLDIYRDTSELDYPYGGRPLY